MWSYNYYGLDSSDSLSHYGVLGMKWGRRKARVSSGSGTKKSKSSSKSGSKKSKSRKKALQKGVKVGAKTVSTLAQLGARAYRIHMTYELSGALWDAVDMGTILTGKRTFDKVMQ